MRVGVVQTPALAFGLNLAVPVSITEEFKTCPEAGSKRRGFRTPAETIGRLQFLQLEAYLRHSLEHVPGPRAELVVPSAL
jgi:hypothetical protein